MRQSTKKGASLLCILSTFSLGICQIDWVQEVGIEAAAQLLINQPDGNYSNLVFLNEAIDEEHDLLWAKFVDILKLSSKNVISIRKQSLSIPVYKTLSSAEPRSHQKSTMYVLTETNPETWKFLYSLNCSELALNSWFITMLNNKNQENKPFLEAAIKEWTSLCFNARVYVLVVSTSREYQLFEAYKIGIGPTIVRLLASFANGSYKFLDFDFIWERRQDLHGHQFRISALEGAPFVQKNDTNSTEWSGIFADLLRLMQQEMNFTYIIQEPKQKSYGVLENGTWTGIMGEISNSLADFSISDLSVTDKRSQAVDFTLGIYEEVAKLYMKKPKRTVSWTTFVEVFAIDFWIALALTFVGLTVLFYVIFLFVRSETTIGVGTSVSTVFLSFLGLGIPVNPTRIPGRTLVLCVSFSGAIVFWSYNAGLVSLLTVDTIFYPIKTLDDLAAKSQYKLLLERETAFVEYFSTATKKDNPAVYEIWQRLDRQTQLMPTNAIEQSLIDDGFHVFFGPQTGTLVNFKSVPCNVTAVSPDYFKVSIAWATQKHFPFLPLLNFQLTKIKETGQLNRIMRKYLSSHNVACDSSVFKPIEILNIFTAFLLLLFGVVFAVSTGAIEKYFRKGRKRAKKT